MPVIRGLSIHIQPGCEELLGVDLVLVVQVMQDIQSKPIMAWLALRGWAA